MAIQQVMPIYFITNNLVLQILILMAVALCFGIFAHRITIRLTQYFKHTPKP